MSEHFSEIQNLLQTQLQFGTQPPFVCHRELPSAYTEWASIHSAADLLHRFSNSDDFWFTPREEDFLSTDKGEILLFSRESQGNFELGVLVSTSKVDPPVLFSDYRRDRWTQYCSRFTDALFTQIFDYQFRIFLDQNGNPEVDYYETLDVVFSTVTLSALREAYI
jgi:hypothetical protein